MLLLWVTVPAQMAAQSIGNSVISGKILDAQSGEPLAGVHVFLSSRLKGTTTDANGQYKIEHLPRGSYKVVASIIGYVSGSQEIQVQAYQNVRLDIPLAPLVYELGGVEITGTQPREWKKQLKEFRQRFLGNSGNAKESQILNPYVLSFEDDGTIFQARAAEPLEIENLSLGYTLTFVLDQFVYNSAEDKRYTSGNWYFEEMEPETEEQEEGWVARREMAFKGSLQHLLWAMVNHRIDDEGFSILRDYSEGKNAPELFIHRYHPVHVEDIIAETTSPYEYEMAFDDFIRVYYVRDGEKGKLFRKVTIPAEQLSYLRTTGEKIVVHQSGYMYGSKALSGNLLVFGHLAELGVADLLPQEYPQLRSSE